MKPFEHVDAGSLEEALSLLRTHGGTGCVMAGGTDLIGVLKDQILQDYPEVLINLKTIPALDTVEGTSEGLSIGALTKLALIASSPLVKSRYAALAQAAESIASPEIRNMGTLGGNLCQEVRCWYYRYPHHMGGRMLCLRKGKGPCYAVKGDNRYHAIVGAKKCFAVCPSDTAIALSALRAGIELVGGKGKRTLPVEEFFTPLGVALEKGELVKEVRIPDPPAGSRQAFLKFTERRPIDFAVASVAAVIRLQEARCVEARIFLGGVAPIPWRAAAAEQSLLGKTIDPSTAEEAARASVSGAKPLRGNAYKLEIVKALVKRAILS